MRIKGSELRRIIKEEISRSLVREQDSGLAEPDVGAGKGPATEDIASVLSGRTFESIVLSLDYEKDGFNIFNFTNFVDENDLRQYRKINLDEQLESIKCYVHLNLIVEPGRENIATFLVSHFFNAESGRLIDSPLITRDDGSKEQLNLVNGIFAKTFFSNRRPSITLPKPVSPGRYKVEALLSVECQDLYAGQKPAFGHIFGKMPEPVGFRMTASLEFPAVIDDSFGS